MINFAIKNYLHKVQDPREQNSLQTLLTKGFKQSKLKIRSKESNFLTPLKVSFKTCSPVTNLGLKIMKALTKLLKWIPSLQMKVQNILDFHKGVIKTPKE